MTNGCFSIWIIDFIYAFKPHNSVFQMDLMFKTKDLVEELDYYSILYGQVCNLGNERDREKVSDDIYFWIFDKYKKVLKERVEAESLADATLDSEIKGVLKSIADNLDKIAGCFKDNLNRIIEERFP